MKRRLESMTRKALYDFDMLEGSDPLAIALSGGKDSITLLYMLKAILGRGFKERPLIAIHVSGSFSCGAAIGSNYLKKICNELGVELVIKTSERKLEDLECYSCSRERRKLIFNEARAHGAKAIAFGHHKDDQIETLLLNLLHKGEFAGLLPKTPMHKFGIDIIRPLIYVSEEEILRFAKDEGFARITCQCPVGQNSKRRQVKDQIRELEKLFPNVRTNLAHASLQYGSQKAARTCLSNR